VIQYAKPPPLGCDGGFSLVGCYWVNWTRPRRIRTAKLAGVSPHTVRHYQRIGLVCPEKRPIQTGFAYVYFERDVERIRAIALHNLHFMAHFRPGLVRYFHEKATAQSRVLPVALAAIRQLYSRQTNVRSPMNVGELAQLTHVWDGKIRRHIHAGGEWRVRCRKCGRAFMVPKERRPWLR